MTDVLKTSLLAALAATLAASAAAQMPAQWMSSEVGDAWAKGYRGQGVTITVVDDFTSNRGLYGNLSGSTQLLRHGSWTAKEAGMVAPRALLLGQDYSGGQPVWLNRGLNVINLSYGAIGQAGYTANQIPWSPLESSLIKYATLGSSVIAKAAGNDAVPVNAVNAAGNVDYLNLALKGKASAIYVGALSSNGSVLKPASMAAYSNTAGTDAAAQKQFLVVGVEGDKTGLYGTSFAAPIVTGYSAILGSKFNKASATQITNQLLNTARQDTIANYNSAVHGRGEASITRALAPSSIR